MLSPHQGTVVGVHIAATRAEVGTDTSWFVFTYGSCSRRELDKYLKWTKERVKPLLASAAVTASTAIRNVTISLEL